ncbi:hypothetical protein E2C01_010385 [Portunus trituberculatus]|uniref:Uncharacterized protein n=1 Tax=Portunus trituberculatus TaxID=210409 RepID=A0A5B7D8H6_PORTR|nr:hypothetical protein [Portunus trituberculatus]
MLHTLQNYKAAKLQLSLPHCSAITGCSLMSYLGHVKGALGLSRKGTNETLQYNEQGSLSDFYIKSGMSVLTTNIRNETQKGGKTEPKWSGPYK